MEVGINPPSFPDRSSCFILHEFEACTHKLVGLSFQGKETRTKVWKVFVSIFPHDRCSILNDFSSTNEYSD